MAVIKKEEERIWGLYAYHYTTNHEYVKGRGESFDKQEELISKMKQDKYRDDSKRYRGRSYLNR